MGFTSLHDRPIGLHELLLGTKMRTIISHFTTISQGRIAIHALLTHNYDSADISFLVNDSVMNEERDPPAVGSVALGVLVGLGTRMVPGVGPLLAAGPLLFNLAGVGSNVDRPCDQNLADTLRAVSIPDDATQRYSEAIDRGEALVMMGAREEVAANIMAILQDCGAVRIDLYLRDPALSSA